MHTHYTHIPFSIRDCNFLWGNYITALAHTSHLNKLYTYNNRIHAEKKVSTTTVHMVCIRIPSHRRTHTHRANTHTQPPQALNQHTHARAAYVSICSALHRALARARALLAPNETREEHPQKRLKRLCVLRPCVSVLCVCVYIVYASVKGGRADDTTDNARTPIARTSVEPRRRQQQSFRHPCSVRAARCESASVCACVCLTLECVVCRVWLSLPPRVSHRISRASVCIALTTAWVSVYTK